MRDRENHSICITCGQESTSARLNRLEDDRICPTCRDRLLHQLAPAVPGFTFERAESPSGADEGDESPVVPERRSRRSRGPRKTD